MLDSPGLPGGVTRKTDTQHSSFVRAPEEEGLGCLTSICLAVGQFPQGHSIHLPQAPQSGCTLESGESCENHPCLAPAPDPEGEAWAGLPQSSPCNSNGGGGSQAVRLGGVGEHPPLSGQALREAVRALSSLHLEYFSKRHTPQTPAIQPTAPTHRAP